MLKNNRANAGQFGGKLCKGICGHLEKARPYRNPYKTHALCRSCIGTGICYDGVWMELAALNPTEKRGLVCPCCNKRPKQKPTKKTPYLNAKTNHYRGPR